MAAAEHSETAARFMEMCKTFDALIPVYERMVPQNQNAKNYPEAVSDVPYIKTHLEHFVRQYQQSTAPKRSGGHCDTFNRGRHDDGKRELPRTIQRAINSLPDFADSTAPWGKKRAIAKDLKVRVCWVISYLENVRPNTSDPHWRRFQCSHRCLNDNCSTLVMNGGAANAHVCWESPSENQNRGHNRNLCFKLCSHCQLALCHCQNIHNPACL